ncbi:PKD domain-containing protein [Microbacterium sp.]|uniref:PKD domain-containing protein n=1 Tax=Microbacterium sp. TaxID=51671 RepID=UPI0039E5FCAF
MKSSRTHLLIALIVMASVLLPLPAQATQATASISGTVTFVGAPANGVSWTIDALEYWGEGFDGGVAPPGAVVTKSGSGAFSISNLRPGYDVTLRVSVYFGDEWWPSSVYLGGVASIGAADVMHLAAGEHRSVSMTVERGARMSGKMTLTDGSPVANGKIGVWTAGTGYVNSSFAISTRTNAEGEWSLALPLGSYKVGFTNGQSAVNNLGLRPAVGGLHNQWSNDRPSYDTSPSVRLGTVGGTVSGIDATLKAEPSTAEGITQAASYIALGDSYQSGEGANPRKFGQPTDEGFYFPSTDNPANRCHRSVNAYPELLIADGFVTGVGRSWACSGALAEDLVATEVEVGEAPWNDPLLGMPDGEPVLAVGKSSLDRIAAENPELITIGIGGNDLGFVSLLRECVEAFLEKGCASDLNEVTRQKIVEIRDAGTWSTLFAKLHAAAPGAHVAVLGYPRFFTDEAVAPVCVDAALRRSDQIWVNNLIKLLNDTIEDAATGVGFQFIDIYDVPSGHEMCVGPGDERFMHGIIPNIGDGSRVWAESYHPTQYGHRLIADAVEGQLASPTTSTPEKVSLSSGENADLRFRVPSGSPMATFTITDTAGTSAVTLTSPNGTVIDASTSSAEVQIEQLAGLQRFTVEQPEAGVWKIAIAVSAATTAGSDVEVISHATPKPNVAPTAAATGVATWDPAQIEFTSSGSADPDGWIVDYFWDFGDGETATGPSATHTYSGPGTFYPTLSVRDSQGAMGVVAITPVHVSGTLVYEHRSDAAASSEIRITDDAAAFDDPYFDPAPGGDQRQPEAGSNGVLFVTDDGNDDALRVPDGYGEYSTLTTAAVITSPALSPDGESVAYAATDADGPGIFIAAVDGETAPTRITSDPSGSDSPSWNPSGDQLMYARTTTTGEVEVLTVDATGASPTVLVGGVGYTSPEWAPDGVSFVFVKPDDDGRLQLFQSPVAGGALTQLTTGTADAGSPAWSPNAKMIAYTSTGGTNVDVWVYDVSSTVSTPVVESAAYDGAPAWW